MIALALAAIFFMIGSSTLAKPADSGLPELHKIKTATISHSYSCPYEQDFHQGYGKTALFLQSSSEQRSRPDLVFNGACGSEDYFESSTAGDDMSMIADLGTEPLEEITAARVFNLKRTHSFDQYSRFARIAKVRLTIRMRCSLISATFVDCWCSRLLLTNPTRELISSTR